MVKKILRFFPILGLLRLSRQFIVAIVEGRLFATLLLFSDLFVKHRRNLHQELDLLQREFARKNIADEMKAIEGLHSLLAKDKSISFSILISAESASVPYLRETLDSALAIPSPFVEVICEIPKDAEDLFRKEFSDLIQKGVRINVPPANLHILLAYPGELLRLEILYRYEQILRKGQDPALVLFTKSVAVNKRRQLISVDDPDFDNNIRFPYQFAPLHFQGLLLPRQFFLKIDRGRDIGLQLDAFGAHFWGSKVPLLYRLETKKREIDGEAFLSDFRDYVKKKSLSWEILPGLLPHTVRAIPQIAKRPRIFAIMPFKDQKEMTLTAARKLQSSHGIDLTIIAIDNGSQDPTIREELTALGITVIPVLEPFNYSRLNNLAVQSIDNIAQGDLLFFINNDAHMEEEALLEMARWASDPAVGMVGAALFYPDETVQHGGVERLEREGESIFLVHSEMGVPFSEAKAARLLHHAYAVTSAASMMRFGVFQEVGGFEEILYPNAFADTSLEKKIVYRGYICLYTPFARGIHYESKSRKAGLLEEFDRSKTLDAFFASTFAS